MLHLVILGLFICACGNERRTQTITEATTTATTAVDAPVEDELVDTSPWGDLIGTKWAITAMAGFTADRYADATFTFRVDRFGYFDGVNWKGSEIVWTDSGFTVTQTGDSTSMGADEGNERYLSELVEAGVQVEITRNPDGSLTLTQDKRSVTAAPVP